jgi:hypothetical protein
VSGNALRQSHCLIVLAVAIHQVADTGYVFGAYTAVSWPNQPAAGAAAMTVRDDSSASFLFSLVNESHRAFRLSLVDRSRVVSACPNGGPCFGGEVRDADGAIIARCSLLLMHDGRAANQRDGNGSNDHKEDEAYQLDEWVGEGPSAVPPAGFKFDADTFAGKQFFAAEQIEVYAM